MKINKRQINGKIEVLNVVKFVKSYALLKDLRKHQFFPYKQNLETNVTNE